MTIMTTTMPDIGKAIGASHALCMNWNATVVLLTFAARAVASGGKPFEKWMFLSVNEYSKVLRMSTSAVSSGLAQLLNEGYFDKSPVIYEGKKRVVYRLTKQSTEVIKALETE